MRYSIKRKPALIISLIVILGILVTILPSIVSAAAVTASLSPSASSVQQGNTFTVTVNLSTGSATIIDTVGRVNFNTSQLEYISASYGPSSSWGSQGPEAGLNVSFYKFDVTTTLNPAGNLGVVSITFKALANSGSSSITLSNVEVGDGDNPPPAVHSVSSQNTSVTLTAPPAPTTTTPPVAPSTPAKTTTTTPPKNTQTAYAPSETPLATAEEQQANSNLSDEQPVPVESFTDSTGYPVEIKIIDKNGNPLINTEVKIADQTATTDENGIATFYGITAGEYTVEANGVKGVVTVAPGEPTEAQTFELGQTEDSSNKLFLVAIPLVVLLLAVAGAFLYKNKRGLKNQPQTANINNQSSPSQKQTSENTLSPDQEDYLKPEPPLAETVIHPDNKE